MQKIPPRMPPESLLRSKWPMCFWDGGDRCTPDDGTTSVRANAEPDCRWHSWQWQTFKECGSEFME